MKPSTQSQVKLPTESLQTAFMSQLSRPSIHSLISAEDTLCNVISLCLCWCVLLFCYICIGTCTVVWNVLCMWSGLCVCDLCSKIYFWMGMNYMHGFENDLPQSIVIADKALHCAYIYCHLVAMHYLNHDCGNIALEIIFILVQVNPFPRYPVLQLQWKLPSVLVHSASRWQVEEAAHSSTSVGCVPKRHS